ncbi:hypothetical protein C8R44DRAFT_743178 [Mycena epipterygia]|nr:hypothetical protein C8R44DRAFT_743178 [Mycena epipterygia]
MPPLPSAFSPRVATVNPTAIQQYRRVHTAEHATQTALNHPSTQTQIARKRLQDDLVCLRVLGQTMLQVDGSEGLNRLTATIVACKDGKLVALGKFYLRFFVKIFYKAKGHNPVPSEHPSRPSFEQERVMHMQQRSLSHSEAKTLALERDGNRCLLTGAYHGTNIETPEEIEHYRLTGQNSTSTHAAHIIPEHLNNFTWEALDDAADREFFHILEVDGITSEPKINQSSTMWTMLKIFGSQQVIDELGGTDIHRLENVITVDVATHDQIDLLQLWFEPTGIPDEHFVRVRLETHRPSRLVPTIQPNPILSYPEPVTKIKFPSTPDLPAPSPHYLALHAACCRIAVLSGAADHLDQVQRDFDDFKRDLSFQVSHEALDAMSRAMKFGHTMTWGEPSCLPRVHP